MLGPPSDLPRSTVVANPLPDLPDTLPEPDDLDAPQPTPAESAGVGLHTRAVLKKYAKKLTAEECEAATPYEVVVLENDKVVQIWHPGDEEPCPE